MSWIENFKSILDLNLLTQLEYLSWIFWLNLNTWVKNSDLNRVLTSWKLNSISMTRLNVISLNTNKLKEILRSTFEVIYHKFHIIFDDVTISRSDSMLMFMTQRSNYNVRRWFRVRETQQDNLKYNSSSFFQLKTHSHLLSYVVCNEQDLKRSQSVSVRSVKILIIQISCNLNCNICCRSQDFLRRESVKNSICINDMKYDKFIKLIENKLNYNCVTDMMIYDRAEFVRIYISNECKWKTALKEMHAEKSIHFLFTIQFAANNDCRFQIFCDTWFKQLITEEIM